MGRATQRSIEILELIAQEPGDWTHTAIARRLDIPKSTLTDLLRDLVNERYLDLEEGRHLVGPRVLVLARAYLRRLNVVDRSRDLLIELSTRSGEAASVAVRQDCEIVVVAQERPSKPLLAAMTLGDRAPLLATAAGKCIAAFLPPDEIDALFARSQQKGMFKLSHGRRSTLLKELEQVRRGSLASNHEEWMDGICAFALPIHSASGVVAAIAVAAPLSRVTQQWQDTLGEQLRIAATELSVRMGADLNTTQGDRAVASEKRRIG